MTTQNIINLTQEIQELKTALALTLNEYEFNEKILSYLRDNLDNYKTGQFEYADYFIVEWNEHADKKAVLKERIVALNLAITEKEKSCIMLQY